MPDVKTRPGLRLAYTTVGGALTVNANSGTATAARTGVGVVVVTFQAGEGYGTAELNVQATPRLATFAAVTYTWDSATQITVRTWDAAGAALECAVDLRIERMPPV